MDDLEQRFWPKVNQTGPVPTHRPELGPCWLWCGTILKRRTGKPGYGQLRYKGRGLYAHRVAYTLLVGPIPDGMTVDHLCRVQTCVRPTHLDVCTAPENARRAPKRSWSRKTHCPAGHPYDATNTWVSKQGWRQCRACWTARRLARSA